MHTHHGPATAALISNKELIHRWECSRTTARRRRKTFRLVPVKILGNLTFYRLAEVEAAEAQLHTRNLARFGFA